MTDSILLAFVITLGAVFVPILIWFVIGLYAMMIEDFQDWWETKRRD